MTGEEIESEAHYGKIKGSDILIQKISHKENEYFSQFHIGFDTPISYIKFMTNSGEKMNLETAN